MVSDPTRALGNAVVALWSELPTDVQHAVFEAAVHAGGNGTREKLALFLHDRHPRTAHGTAAERSSRQVPEPDSLGG